jgi:hypothetical protein
MYYILKVIKPAKMIDNRETWINDTLQHPIIKIGPDISMTGKLSSNLAYHSVHANENNKRKNGNPSNNIKK